MHEQRLYDDDMMFKVTQWIDLGNKNVELRLKDCDDNPEDLGVYYDVIEAVDNNAVSIFFHDCRLVGRDMDMMDGDYSVHPYVFSYDTVNL